MVSFAPRRSGFDHQERPAWALSLTGIESRFKEERRQRLGQLLMEEAQGISMHFRASTVRYEALSRITPFPADFQRPMTDVIYFRRLTHINTIDHIMDAGRDLLTM